jgi:carbonic anhydrase
MTKTIEPPTSLPARLRDGYQAFRSGRLPTEQSRYRDLAERGQAPETMVIGCCDSRVSPEVIFDAGPGELFVVRNVANLVPPYAPDSAYHGVSAALEYAVLVLGVRHIVVLGHARCGGVAAYANDAPPGDFIGKWIPLLRPAAASVGSRAEAPGSYLTRLERASLLRLDREPEIVPVHSRSLRPRHARALRRVFRRGDGRIVRAQSRDPALHGGRGGVTSLRAAASGVFVGEFERLGGRGRLLVPVLRRRDLARSGPALERRLITLPWLDRAHHSGLGCIVHHSKFGRQ